MDPRAGGRGGDGSAKFHQALIQELHDFARRELELGEVLDGATVREHLESVERQTGILHEALHGESPDGLMYLWEYFVRLNMRRQSTEGMPDPITNTELKSWAELNGVSLSTFEVEILDSLDCLLLTHCRKRALKK